MSSLDRRTAVLLLNMGGPDSLGAVQPFLTRLFSDPAIVPLPGFFRLPLARVLGRRRARKVRPRYSLIGGRSPIGEITDQQATALREILTEEAIDPAGVFPAFSYWHPLIAEAVRAAVLAGAEHLTALSLYPQYCSATTGACVSDLSRSLPETPFETSTTIIDSWPDHPGYLDALAGTVVEALGRIPVEERDDAVILFSAHGVPESLVRRGDPYVEETARTVAGVMERVGDRPHVLAFQSRLGPVRWTEPNLQTALRDLSLQGSPPLVVVPVSFVSDHIETLYELDIQHRDLALDLGFTRYERAPALNTRPDFIRALADLILDRLTPS